MCVCVLCFFPNYLEKKKYEILNKPEYLALSQGSVLFGDALPQLVVSGCHRWRPGENQFYGRQKSPTVWNSQDFGCRAALEHTTE